MHRTRRDVVLRPDIEGLDRRIVPTASLAEAFLDKQVALDIRDTAAHFKTYTTDLANLQNVSDQQLALDQLQVTRSLMIGTLDQQFDVQQNTAPGVSAPSLAEVFIDKQVTTDFASATTDFKTLTTDVANIQNVSAQKLALDQLQVTRDLMFAALDQQLDLMLDAPTGPTTDATAATTTPATT